MLELISIYRDAVNQFNTAFVDPWFDNPISEYWLNQSMDTALKLYYWPFYAVTMEDRFKEFANTYSICRV